MIALLGAEDFEDLARLRPAVAQGVEDEIRAAAFAEGFEAGRSFAHQQGEDVQARSLERIAENLQDLHVAAVAARAQVLGSLAPLLRAITGAVLPAAASAGLRDLVAQELATLADRLAPPELTLELGHAAAAALARCSDLPPGVALSESAALAPLEVRIRAPGVERRVDLDAALSAIARAIDDFASLQTEIEDHG